MHNSQQNPTTSQADECSAEDAVRVAATAADGKHAQDILALHVRELTTLADYFLITSARSAAQVQAIYEAIDQAMTTVGREPIQVEGKGDFQWVLMDYADIVVHVFLGEAREFYNLERLWSDAPKLDLGLTPPESGIDT